jgi:putative DNA primase/helicase
MTMANRTPLRDRARGRWPGVLSALGISTHPKFLKRQNCPCPMCGGRDRFRFLDTNGDGTWICTHCGPGAGVGLVMKFTGLPFRDAAVEIERVLGDAAIVVRQERDDRRYPRRAQ